jgi:hypothetical protein
MTASVDARHLPALLGSAGKAIAAMPEGKRVVQQLKEARSKEDFLFLLRSADLGLADPARDLITSEAGERWKDVRAQLVRSAELQLHERYSANA